VRQQTKKTVREEVPARASASRLNECLVDGDESSNRNARRARRKALGVSVVVQAALLSAAVILPLPATVAVPRSTVLTPIPPYAGLPRLQPTNPAQHPGQSHPPNTRPGTTIIFTPQVPTRVWTGNDDQTRESGPPTIGTSYNSADPIGIIGGSGPATNALPPGLFVETKPQPPKPDTKRARISEGVQEAMLIHRVEPRYPPLAVQTRLQGTVHLHAIVGTDGVIRDLQLLDGHILLGRAALEAVAQWRYRPTILNGEPVEVDTYITVVFKLGQ
jgi:protein TonB